MTDRDSVQKTGGMQFMYCDQPSAIDFPAVLDQFAAFAASPKTARHIQESKLIRSPHVVRDRLEQAKEAGLFLDRGGEVSLGGLGDIVSSVKAARKGMTLTGNELLEISQFLSACQAAAGAFQAESEPLLYDLASSLSDQRALARLIDEAIDLSGQIRPDASARLQNLSNRLLQTRADLSAAARRFIKGHADSLVDTTTVYSSSRLCVLVKSSDKYRFGGIVHGSSQSGAASYVEPDVLVPLNNAVAETENDIEEEKKRICFALSQEVKSNARALLSNDETLETIDLAMAKGRWMKKHDGCVPVMQSADHSISIDHAVHPLLDPAAAVANSYHIGAGRDCLMITGSNMGGKTVTLKTIALFILLAQHGFPVGAHRAILPVYEQFYFDIGDEQSIENNLSTFSSHISKIARILKKADEKTFVLLDEIGSGTDPAEGAALAQAVIEALIERKATILTSTHYNQVKAFGKTNESVMTGAVEFDPVSLRPTYRFLPEISGASCAFDVARQCGLNGNVLSRARALKKQNESEASRQLEILEKQQAKVQKQKDRFDALVADAHRLQKKADEDQKKWASMKQRLDDDYARKLDDMLYEKKEEARKILRELRESTGKASHEQIEKMGELSQLESASEVKMTDAEREQEKIQEQIGPGDYVHVTTLNNHGEVVSVRKNKAVVMVNGRRVNVTLDQLEKMKKPGRPPKIRKRQTAEPSFRPFPLECNLIGMRVEEGIRELDHYIDQAVYHNVKNVRIIHGMGTGALRNAVWKDLKSHPQVRSISAGGPSDGGLGATLVELK